MDTFFSSLANDQEENAICIILAGTGSDGTLGLGRVKEAGGFTLAQAEFDHSAMSGMPRSAAATGLVDEVLPVEDIPARLISYQQHLQRAASQKEADGTRRDAAQHLASIARLLHARSGHDFSEYKEKTVTRRIQRRMQVLQIDTFPAYVARLKEEPQQLDLLFRELLIGVTQFYRDPAAFEALEATVVAKLPQSGNGEDPIRVWVPACSTGEEVYTLAALVKEAMSNRAITSRLQIFGTDVDEEAVTFARAGRYAKPDGALPERIRRWFVQDGEEFYPRKEIREVCIFSVHNVIKDAPFSKLDLISCRNLLIYMNSELQDRILRTFHYALKPEGFLFLGPSEGVTRQAKYFVTLDKKHRLFQRRDSEATLPQLAPGITKATPQPELVLKASLEERIARKARQAIEKHSPAYLLIDGNFEILRFSGGEAGQYLEPSSGAASLNLFSILRKTLRPPVRAALRAATATKKTVEHQNIALKVDGRDRLVTLIVEPINGEPDEGLCVVAFRDAGAPTVSPAAGGRDGDHNIQELDEELRVMRAQLQSTIDELESVNEEMKSAAEEYQSVNEELQSSNEELETSKEEMQSINEELQTVNAELAAKNEALMQVNSDIRNLLDSTEIATLFLDHELRIKSFTPLMTEIFHFRDHDRGRPITEIVSMLSYPDLERDVREVMRKLSVIERDVQLTDKGMAFMLRIRPYRSIDNVIDGVVMTFMDVTERQRAHDRGSLLLGELDHRVKNILAIVSSLIKQTLKTSESPAAFAATMEGRITAITRAHSLLTQTGGQGGGSMRNLIRRELEPYDPGGKKFEISGPDMLLTPKAGLALAMAIHELASNASKYGALSTATGRLAVTWDVEGDAKDRALRLLWNETGGPKVKKTRKAGFGSTLIVRTLEHELDGSIEREFLPGGLRCRMTFPLSSEIGRLMSPAEVEDARHDGR
ncbi:MAG: CheR family methyltransferase [Parvibaculaceae bacterium]